MVKTNPILPFIERQGVMVLDGGLATTLEARGADLADDLWSARILIDDPKAIRAAHLDFLRAGADCVTGATYQASLPGFTQRGYTPAQAAQFLNLAVQLAVEARDECWHEQGDGTDRIQPIVAASIGPYGAFLADGSEYKGNYAVAEDDLLAFHEERWRILAASDADLLACETIPSAREALVLLNLLKLTPGVFAWISFSCRDGEHLSDGTRLVDAVMACDRVPEIVAVGINCTAPRFIPSLIEEARRGTEKPLVVYPNSGERYNATTKQWEPGEAEVDLVASARDWAHAGASLVGGCCRVGPEIIRRMRERLLT